MLLLISTKPRRAVPDRPPRRSPGLQALLLIALLLGLLWATTDFFDYDDQGNPILHPERGEKLARELNELDHAEQYVLIAARNGPYPCYHCAGKSTIFLQRGHVWKYGVTRKGETGRYGRWHLDMGLLYVIQYEGPWQDCLREEKTKIYHYAIHPENLARPVPLIRPPGNKQDN